MKIAFRLITVRISIKNVKKVVSYFLPLLLIKQKTWSESRAPRHSISRDLLYYTFTRGNLGSKKLQQRSRSLTLTLFRRGEHLIAIGFPARKYVACLILSLLYSPTLMHRVGLGSYKLLGILQNRSFVFLVA